MGLWGYRIGYWILDIGYWLMAVGFSPSAIRFWDYGITNLIIMKSRVWPMHWIMGLRSKLC